MKILRKTAISLCLGFVVYLRYYSVSSSFDTTDIVIFAIGISFTALLINDLVDEIKKL